MSVRRKKRKDSAIIAAAQAEAERRAEAMAPAAQRRPVLDAEGRMIRGSLVSPSEWRDPEDNDPRRRTPLVVKGYKAVDVVEQFYLQNICTESGTPVVDSDSLMAAHRLRNDFHTATGARLGYMRIATSDSPAVAFGGPSGPQLDAMARYRAAAQALGMSHSMLLAVILANIEPPPSKYDEVISAFAVLRRHYKSTSTPKKDE